MHYETENIVVEALRNLFEELGLKLEINASTIIYGSKDGINSLSLVRLIVDIEEIAFTKYGKQIVIADNRSLSMKNSPFRTVATLTDFVGILLTENE